MSDRGAPRVIDRPQPGFWAVRLGGAGTPEVGAAIIRRTRRSPDPSAPQNIQGECCVLDAFLDGRTVSVDEVWHRRGRPIAPHEYEFLVADRAWARRYSRHEPEARPWDRVNMRKLAPVMPKKG